MAVGDFESSIHSEARRLGIHLLRHETVPWLSGKGHAEEKARGARDEILERLAAVFELLGGNESLLRSKRRLPIRVDFLADDGVIVEIDEMQHFTSDRLQTLDYYMGLQHDLNLDDYRRSCIRNLSDADRYRASKDAADFPFPGGRRAQRAYLDTCRDLLAPAFGYRVVRIDGSSRSVSAAVAELLTRLRTMAD